MTRRRGDDGFALIEAVAVLALASLVLLTLLLASDIVTRNAGAAARRANELEMLATGLAAFREDVTAAQMVSIGSAEAARLLFTGRSSAIGFPVSGDRSDLGRSDNLVWIETRPEGSQTALLRTSAPFFPSTSGFDDASFDNPAVLIQGPWTYRFSYGRASGDSLSWSGSWADTRMLPAAIRLEVFDRAGLSPMLPPLVVPIHINSIATCPDQSQPPCEEENAAEPQDPDDQEGEGDENSEL
jgi:hypothetical protein